MPTICIVIPYFGQWPLWMPFFVESCRTNPTIDWLLYTDCGSLENCPANVQVNDIKYSDYCKLVSTRLGISFAPENTYKLCDIKPALGHIHAEALHGYDFWAFGDIDLVYGDLRRYFTTERLAQKDLFSTHARRISGHFCLIRNTQELRMAYQRVKGWQAYIQAPQHTAFDEKPFSKIFLRHKNSPAWVRKIAALRDPWLSRAEFVEAYTTPYAKIKWTDGTQEYPTRWHWQNGKLTNEFSQEEAIPYFHFMIWKKQWRPQAFQEIRHGGQQAFDITENGFTIIK